MASLGTVHLTTIDVIAALPRCRDCRWWEDVQGDPVLSAEAANRGAYGSCVRITLPATISRGYGARDAATIVAIYDPDGIEEELTADESHICHILLSTGPDFGCLQFQSREEAPRDA